jgi:hypothetical protein
MSDSDYKYSYSSGPFYRKFMAGDNVWCEVNRDGEVVRVTLGEPGDPESEFICMIHRSYIPDLISGFSQMCERKKK